MNEVERERAQRILYNQKAIAAAGETKRMRYGGLVIDAEAPATLVKGNSIGIVAVEDNIFEQLPKDAQYSPGLMSRTDKGGGYLGNRNPFHEAPQGVVTEDSPSELFFESLESLLG